jgi:hypothetical protein
MWRVGSYMLGKTTAGRSRGQALQVHAWVQLRARS